jgi:hypothetical protein
MITYVRHIDIFMYMRVYILTMRPSSRQPSARATRRPCLTSTRRLAALLLPRLPNMSYLIVMMRTRRRKRLALSRLLRYLFHTIFFTLHPTGALTFAIFQQWIPPPKAVIADFAAVIAMEEEEETTPHEPVAPRRAAATKATIYVISDGDDEDEEEETSGFESTTKVLMFFHIYTSCIKMYIMLMYLQTLNAGGKESASAEEGCGAQDDPR